MLVDRRPMVERREQEQGNGQRWRQGWRWFEDVPDEGVDAVVVEGVGGGTLSYCMPPVLRLGRP